MLRLPVISGLIFSVVIFSGVENLLRIDRQKAIADNYSEVAESTASARFAPRLAEFHGLLTHWNLLAEKSTLLSIEDPFA